MPTLRAIRLESVYRATTIYHAWNGGGETECGKRVNFPSPAIELAEVPPTNRCKNPRCKKAFARK